MKIGDLVQQQFNGRRDDVGLVIDIKQSTHGADRFRDIEMVTILWCTDQEERENRRYRVRDLEVVSASR